MMMMMMRLLFCEYMYGWGRREGYAFSLLFENHGYCSIAIPKFILKVIFSYFGIFTIFITSVSIGNSRFPVPGENFPKFDFHSQLILTGNSRFREFSFFFFQLVSWILPTAAILIPYDVYQLIRNAKICNKE